MQITRSSIETKQAPKSYILGMAWMEEIVAPPPPSRLRVFHVHFMPGARTAWHSHPFGQLLQVTQGSGLVQRNLGLIEKIHLGDSVWIEPDEWHWHGAGPTTLMSHMATQELDLGDSTAHWGEHVSDAEYLAQNQE